MTEHDIWKTTIEKHITALQEKLDQLFKSQGYNEYAVCYYEGKIDALKSLLKNGDKMLVLDEGFGL